MTDQQPNPALPSPKILLPVGIVLVLGAIAAFVFMDLHLVSMALAGLIGLAGAAMTLQSITRLIKKE